MKRLCKNCFSYIDRSFQICPKCHQPVNKKATKEPKINCEDARESNVVAVDISDPNVVWIPKHKRLGYKQQKEFFKGTNKRESGLHIDVSDVSFLDRRQQNKYSPPTLDENGEKDYRQPKLEWWEIYKFADRYMARKKIKKIVKKEAVKRPKKTSYWITLLLCLFLGPFGVHNFYTKNYKRGIVSISLLGFASLVLVLMNNVLPWLQNVQLSLCGLPALIVVIMWISDFSAILLKKYQYTESKLNFIYGLDIQTRARLNNKYINVPNWYEYKG